MGTIHWQPPDPFIEVLHVQEEHSSFIITIQSTSQSCPCPHCGVPSSRPHSRYTRLVQDLPIGEKSVTLLLLTRKWFCDHNVCDMKIFSERYEWLSVNGRRTLRAEEFLRKIAFSTSCLNGEKLAKAMHIPVSHDVLLSIIRKTDLQPEISPFCGY
ncbi:transposase family protein [Calidifontibacillus erzurumensis]|uniref:Transposase n=1 Tax=Calidifontibacillus erzurumensis TaxID=2741433 RepID=A0A8J8GHA4_9BACI|nr:transposase family protein [Calidifontibacillus erzurumensis]NSL53369.1 transposase [Calidifontibacillus erzurumensis]